MKNEQLTPNTAPETFANASAFISKTFNKILDGAVPKSKQMIQLLQENTPSEAES